MTLGNTTQPTGGSDASASRGGELAIQWFHGGTYGQRLSLCGSRTKIGRGADCHVRLEHPSVSREHAELYRQGPIQALRDLGSRNGTHLNGRRIEHGVLSPGDVIRAGELVGVIVLDGPAEETIAFGELAPGVFGGGKLQAALSNLATMARTDLPVLIVGPTGSGKERVARAIHAQSGRGGKFHAINCSTLPASMAEAELLGHERGAFTGADRARQGHFRAAHGGTLLLDEIADLSPAVQVKLLRVLQEREVTPLGSTDAVSIDVRIVVAAQEPLEQLVEQKRVREDLWARLAGFRLDLPALSARRDEIPGLFAHFLRAHALGAVPVVEAKLVELLCLQAWPGNVRELELFARKLAALRGTERVLKRQHAAELLPSVPTEPSAERSSELRSRREHDRSRLNDALTRLNGNMAAAARSIGISRRRAYRLLAGDGADECPDEARVDEGLAIDPAGDA